MQELEWIKEAKKHLGLKEIVGTKAQNPTIVQWLKDMGTFPGAAKSGYFEDETPWCGLFVGHCLGVAERFVIKDWYRAGAWADSSVMTKLDKPAYGAIAVKKRKGGNHVFFIVGKNAKGQIMGWGGNQGNQVSCIPFNAADIDSIWWPSKVVGGKAVKSSPSPERYVLPIVSSTGKFGASEA